jgi:protein-tyrosine phosphatase
MAKKTTLGTKTAMMPVLKNYANILFVCTGNICRSPMAEGILKKLLHDARLEQISAASAGVCALPGNPASSLARRVAAENGVDLSKHRARPVSSDIMDQSDLVLAMEPSHRHDLIASYPEARNRIFLARCFADTGSSPRSVADPYGLRYESYRFCYLDLEDAVRGLVHHLKRRT